MEGGVVSALKGNRRCRNACRKRREAMEESNKATICAIAALRLTTAKHKQPGRLEQHARRKAYTPVRANNPTDQARYLWIDRIKKAVLCVLVSLWLTKTSHRKPSRAGHQPQRNEYTPTLSRRPNQTGSKPMNSPQPKSRSLCLSAFVVITY